MSEFPPGKRARTTEASRVYDALRSPRSESDGWSAECPRHLALLQVRVSGGRIRSIRCAASEDCPEVERLKRIGGGS